jgi:type III secretory pathway component EscT
MKVSNMRSSDYMRLLLFFAYLIVGLVIGFVAGYSMGAIDAAGMMVEACKAVVTVALTKVG